MIALIRKAGIKDGNLEMCLRTVAENCEVCCRYKKPRPCPVVSMPMASKFNELVALDLKSYEGVYFLVIVDHFTRFCSAIVIRNKRPETIIRGLFMSWITVFGAPYKFFSDNGGEFCNSEMRELGEQFNIKLMNTAAESPWSNGVCERLNAVLGKSVKKIQEDVRCSVEIALAWAVSARNGLSNFSGYSPNQLVFGFNPVLPNVFGNAPPALDVPEVSQVVRNNLNALHSAREDFVRVESEERVKRALKHNIRETSTSDIQTGQEVFYKRADSDRWRGPGVVIGRDGKQVLVKHGGVYVRVHTCRLNKTPPLELNPAGEGLSVIKSPTVEASGSPSSRTPLQYPLIEEEHGDSGVVENSSGENVSPGDDEENQSLTDSSLGEDTPPVTLPSDSGDNRGATCKPKAGVRIQGVHSETGQLVSGKIIGRAGKATGQFKNCFNLKWDSDGGVNWVDLDKDFTSWKIVNNEEEMLVLFNSSEVEAAKQREVSNWVENDVFEEVECKSQELLSVRWVITEKIKNGVEVVKARLVVRGFEEDTLSLRKDSPTCCKESVRLALSIASSKRWVCHTIDVKAAYLQGNKIEREIFVMPPPEFFNGKVWRLKKTVYGLSDAARAWYLRVKEELLKLNVIVSTIDPALFYWKNGEEYEGVICVYVDDFLWAGTKDFEQKVIGGLGQLFTIGGAESKSFKYIGLNIETHDEGIFVDQNQYASSLRQITVSRERAMQKHSELSEKEKTSYRAAIGQLNWIATHSRPDVAFDVCELSSLAKQAKINDLLRLNKVIQRVIHDQHTIAFPKIQALDRCSLECFCDASFGNLSDGGSQGAYVVFLRDSLGRRCPLLWQTRKIRRVVKSTLSAETMALLDCAEAAVYIAHVLSEVSGCPSLPIYCAVDNRSLVDSLYSTNQIEDKRLRIDLAVLRDMLEKKEIHKVAWVASSQQLADCLTKRGASAVQLRQAMSLL